MAATVEIQTDMVEAVNRDDIAYGERHYFCCPWAPVSTVRADRVRIGDTPLKAGNQFTFDVSAEEVPEGGEFNAEILVADFSPTDDVDYCLPGEGHHDE